MCSFKVFFWCGVYLSLTAEIIAGEEAARRNKRFLIFPQGAPTRHQFIGGIGIPADLPYESLTIGHVLKAMYWLPFNETVFRENPFLPEYQVELAPPPPPLNARHVRSTLRWDIYAVVEHRLNSYGFNGQECLLQAICEANAVYFARHYDVFAELMHILLSPSTSLDGDFADYVNFKEAERLGRSAAMCDSYACNMSVLDWFSSVLKVVT